MSAPRAHSDGAGIAVPRARGWGTALGLSLALSGTFFGCSSNRAALARGQGYYEDNQYERALAVWRDLERHEDVFAPTEFARYAYLRGMTDYRLGLRADARHWLSLAKVTEQQHTGGLTSQWQARLEGALEDLNREVFGVRERGKDPVQSIEAPLPAAAAPLVSPSVAPPAAPPDGPPASRPIVPGAPPPP
jgi:hypothetical protein